MGFAEVNGMRLRVGKYGPGASRSDRESLLNAVRSLGPDVSAIVSQMTEIEMIDAPKGSAGV